jgi:DNA-binding MurR/RpiR family transcriptional regulator
MPTKATTVGRQRLTLAWRRGFRDFRAGVAEYIRLPTADLHQDVAPEDSSEQIVQKVFRSSIQALEETLAILDIGAFDRAVDILHRAYHRDFYGVGGSAQIARDVSHKFLRIGIHSIATRTPLYIIDHKRDRHR